MKKTFLNTYICFEINILTPISKGRDSDIQIPEETHPVDTQANLNVREMS